MPKRSQVKLVRLCRYPVKSVGTESIDSIELKPGSPMPGDRQYAIAHARGDWDPSAPAWQHCSNFVRIANIPALAAVSVSYDTETQRIQLTDTAGDRLDATLSTSDGDAALVAWVEQRVAGKLRGPLQLAHLADGTFTDSRLQTPSLMSLSSLRALSQSMGVDLDYRRFRGNLWIDDAEPWAEFGWVGSQIAFGDVVFEIVKPIERCVATAANPETGQRDHNPLDALETLHGERLFGVQARIISGGLLKVGMTGRAEAAEDVLAGP